MSEELKENISEVWKFDSVRNLLGLTKAAHQKVEQMLRKYSSNGLPQRMEKVQYLVCCFLLKWVGSF